MWLLHAVTESWVIAKNIIGLTLHADVKLNICLQSLHTFGELSTCAVA